MYYVYILESKNFKQIYIGFTNDLRRRLSEHNSGASQSTKRYAPWDVIYYEAYQNEEMAKTREHNLKYNGNALRELKKRAGFHTKSGAGGQVALPFVLLVSGLIVEISIAGAFIAYFLSSSSLGEKLSIRAYTAAYAGIQDAMVRISRNKEFVNSSPCSGSPCTYSLTVGSDTTSVTVTRSSDSASNTYTYTVASLGSAGSTGTRKTNLSATLVVHQVTGQVNLQSFTNIPAS